VKCITKIETGGKRKKLRRLVKQDTLQCEKKTRKEKKQKMVQLLALYIVQHYDLLKTWVVRGESH